jgi:hypothetical protein
VVNDFEGGAVARNDDADDLPLAEIGQEQIIVIFGREGVFGVGERSRGRATAEIVHHPERIGLARVEVMGIAVEAAIDHVCEAAHPVVLVGIIVGENLIFAGERDIENVSDAGAENFGTGAVGLDTENTAAVEINGAAIFGFGVVDSLVADCHVEVAVHRELEIRGHMVVPIQRPRIWIGAFDEVFGIGAGFAGIFEGGEARIVEDVKLAFEILQAEHGVEIRGEDGAAAIRMENDDAPL